MCYGQTGSGKTYTMFGSQNVLEDIIDLINGNKLFLHNGILKGSVEVNLENTKDFLSVLAMGEQRKK